MFAFFTFRVLRFMKRSVRPDSDQRVRLRTERADSRGLRDVELCKTPLRGKILGQYTLHEGQRRFLVPVGRGCFVFGAVSRACCTGQFRGFGAQCFLVPSASFAVQ